MNIPSTEFKKGAARAQEEINAEAANSNKWDRRCADVGWIPGAGVVRIVCRGIIAGLLWDSICLITRVVQLIFTCFSEERRGYYGTKVGNCFALVFFFAPAQIVRGAFESIPFMGLAFLNYPSAVVPAYY